MCWTHSKFAKNSNNAEVKLFTEDTPHSMLKWNDFIKIVDGLIKAKVKVVIICSKGEPLLNPKFLEMCEYLNKNKIKFHLSTNASLLKPEIIDELQKTDLSDPETSVIDALKVLCYKIVKMSK